MNYDLLFLKSLFLTILIETIIMIIIFKLIVKNKKVETYRLVLTGILMSFTTLPYLWFIFPNYFQQNLWYITICESFAVVVESVIIFAMLRIKYSFAFICSFACNAISFLIGLLIPWT